MCTLLSSGADPGFSEGGSESGVEVGVTLVLYLEAGGLGRQKLWGINFA